MSEDVDQPEKKQETQEERKTEKGREGLEFPSRIALKDQLTAMEEKVDEYKNQFLRAQAELENMRRRTEREVMNARKFGSEKLLADLLPVMDSLTRGLGTSGSGDPQSKAMREGMLMTLDMLQKAFEKHGVEFINPKLGEPFNPEQHEAMSMVSSPDEKANTIHEVLQKGFQLNGRVLRAAMVVVVSKC